MKQKICAMIIALLMLFAGVALAEEPLPPTDPVPGPATPTDLCAHENTRTVYYFDAPYYYPLNDEYHSVFGRALEEEICLDCGAVLFSEMTDEAYEVYPHVFRNNQCVLCGREVVPVESGSAEGEVVIPASVAEDNSKQFSYTLTGSDLEKANGSLVLRPEGWEVALVLQAEKLLEEIGRSGGAVVAEMEAAGVRAVNVSVRLADAAGKESRPDSEEISLRVYGRNGEPLSVTYTDPEGGTKTEDAGWTESGGGEGFWSVPWLGDGTYEY